MWTLKDWLALSAALKPLMNNKELTMIIKNLSAPEMDPVSVEEAKLFIKLPYEDSAIVYMQIQGAMRFIESLCNIRLLRQRCLIECALTSLGKLASLDIKSCKDNEEILLTLPIGPIMNVVDFKINGLPIFATIVDSNIISIPSAPYQGALVRVVGEFGFGPSPASIPPDLRLALLLKVASFYHEDEALERQFDKLIAPYKNYRI